MTKILPQSTSGIYKIENTVSGKCYIGSAVNIGKRWGDHLWMLENNKHHNRHLQSAWNFYTEDAFAFSVLEIVPDAKMLTVREQSHFDAMKHEYNICPTAGSTLGRTTSPETIAKQSAAHMGNQCAFGYKQSPEHRAKLAAAQMGRKPSPEARQRMSAAHMGHKASPEHRAKISAAGMGRVMSPEAIAKRSKPVLQFTLSMEFVSEYESIKAAKDATGASNIGKCCLDKQFSAGGFVWKFKETK